MEDVVGDEEVGRLGAEDTSYRHARRLRAVASRGPRAHDKK
jgi:hypothetical protein